MTTLHDAALERGRTQVARDRARIGFTREEAVAQAAYEAFFAGYEHRIDDLKTNPDDLVTIAEAARELGMTNANLHRLRTERDDFPDPAVAGLTMRLYSLAELVEWNRLRLEARAR